MRNVMNLVLTFIFVLAATGCEYMPDSGNWPDAEDNPQVGCDEQAPWGTEFCQGDFNLPGANMLEVDPDTATSDWVELTFLYRSQQDTDRVWIEHDRTVVLYPDNDGQYRVTMPNAAPDGDVVVSGNYVWEDITSKEMFCPNTEWGSAQVYFGTYAVVSYPDNRDCELKWNNSSIER